MIVDSTMDVLHAAATGLSHRSRVTADNIANIQTPGFLAGRTNFESALRSSIENGVTPAVTGGTTERTLAPTRLDGNNVNLDEETLIAMETGLRYELSMRAIGDKYSLLRAATR